MQAADLPAGRRVAPMNADERNAPSVVDGHAALSGGVGRWPNGEVRGRACDSIMKNKLGIKVRTRWVFSDGQLGDPTNFVRV